MKNTLLHKLLSCLLAVCLLASALCLYACSPSQPPEPEEVLDESHKALMDEIGGCSDTYVGAVSEVTYENVEDAIADFINVELTGNNETSEVIEFKSEGKLSEKEVSDLKIPEEDLQGAQSIEKFVASYAVTDNDPAKVENSAIKAACPVTFGGGIPAAAEDLNEEKTIPQTKYVVVIIITYGDYFKYFTPMVETGDTVTKSYYDSIFNAEKYRNCTFTSTSTMISKGTIGDETIDETEIEEATKKYADGKVYVKIKSAGQTHEMFVKAKDGGEPKCYLLDSSSGWMEVPLITVGFNTMEELVPFAQQYLDHTFFTKTSYGCKIDQEHLTEYFNQAMGMEGYSEFGEVSELVGSIDYFVSEGVLTAIAGDITVKFAMEEDGVSVSLELSFSTSCKCTDFGTTVVTDPTL